MHVYILTLSTILQVVLQLIFVALFAIGFDRRQQTGYYLAAKLQLPLRIPSNGFQTMKKRQGVPIKIDVKRGGVTTTADLSVCKNVCVIWSNLMIKQITATMYLLYLNCQLHKAMVAFLWMCCQ